MPTKVAVIQKPPVLLDRGKMISRLLSVDPQALWRRRNIRGLLDPKAAGYVISLWPSQQRYRSSRCALAGSDCSAGRSAIGARRDLPDSSTSRHLLPARSEGNVIGAAFWQSSMRVL